MSCDAFPFREDSWGIVDPNTTNLLVFVMGVEKNVTFSYWCHVMCLSSKRQIWISALYDSNTLKTPIGWFYRLLMLCVVYGVWCMLCVMYGDMMLLIETPEDWISTFLLFIISLLSNTLQWLKFKKSFWEAVLWQDCSLG
jgi:hypothetical protein